MSMKLHSLCVWHCKERICNHVNQSLFVLPGHTQSRLGVNGYYKLILWLDKRYNSIALVQSEAVI